MLFMTITLTSYSQSPKLSFSKDYLEIDNIKPLSNIQVYYGSFNTIQEIDKKNPIIGALKNNSNTIKFFPLLPFQVNKVYTVKYNDGLYKFKIPLDKNYQYLKINNIYPNTNSLPSNFLKWYISFSRPVSPVNIYKYISLIDNETQKKVHRAFLDLERPLLSKDQKLLTVWLEPGRQKRDLGPNRYLGQVLDPAKSYTLKIDKGLKDLDGISMKKNYNLNFKVHHHDSIKPHLNSWNLNEPRSNTREPLIIYFNDQLDYGSLVNNVTVFSVYNKHIDGNFQIVANEDKMFFTPLVPWKSGVYILKCSERIEDLAGNNLERQFDRNFTEPLEKVTTEISFIIK